MPAWKPVTDTIITCQQTRSGEYLVITSKGYTATSPYALDIGKRVPIRGGAPVLPKRDPNLSDASIGSDAALAALEGIDRYKGRGK